MTQKPTVGQEPAAPAAAQEPPAPASPSPKPRLLVRAGRRITAWMVFGVLGGLVPIGFIWSARSSAGQPGGIAAVIATGELIVVAVVLSVASMGDLLVSRTKGLSVAALLNIGAGLGVALGGANFYSHVSLANECPSPSIANHVFAWSISTFLISIAVGVTTICIDVHERTE